MESKTEKQATTLQSFRGWIVHSMEHFLILPTNDSRSYFQGENFLHFFLFKPLEELVKSDSPSFLLEVSICFFKNSWIPSALIGFYRVLDGILHHQVPCFVPYIVHRGISSCKVKILQCLGGCLGFKCLVPVCVFYVLSPECCCGNIVPACTVQKEQSKCG